MPVLVHGELIRHLGSSLTDVTYVFDEPTIGLHPHDIERMNHLLLRLRDKGNSGGEIVFEGTVDGLRASGTLTGRHLNDRATLKSMVRKAYGVMKVRGARTHNLQNVGVDIPLRVLVVVTGVAGSGKSSLIHGSVSGRVAFFDSGEARSPAAHAILRRLSDVGLGYVRLGQPLTTLSGGERQRLKLATNMGAEGGVYVLDEPTIWLHLADLKPLLGLLDRLVEPGKSVIVIEHHQAVMAHADWIIDLGPGAGRRWADRVRRPADLVAARSTLTGEHLAAYVR